ncbi:MAG: hypothetical protein JSV18_01050 [Candidatus Bathyarchaeota archaeon]|nr:MAG: hypothetical protein JSV18_01050 [Candidatus Bathyarchaeota archaeon]
MARKIFGKINVEGGTQPSTQLRVLAWDADIDDDDHVGTTNVDGDGSYSIEYKDKNWDWSPLRHVTTWRPDIYVVVQWFNPRSGVWEPVARSKVYSDQDVRADREINLSVTLPETNYCTVYGWVTDNKDQPLPEYTVTAWDEAQKPSGIEGTSKELPTPKGEQYAEFLGSTITNENGHYRIRYTDNIVDLTPRRLLSEGIMAWRRPDIFIKVHPKTGTGILYRSPTYQNVLYITGCRIDAILDKF